MSKNFKLIFIGIIFFCLPLFVSADQLGQEVNFFVNPSYDALGRTQLTAVLENVSPRLYFYIEKEYWQELDLTQRNKIKQSLSFLTEEFEEKIYPVLTSTFGSERSPGIDNDIHITVLLHLMNKEAGGYFNSADEYSSIQVSDSNQREMIYLNILHINTPLAKSFFAHEFMHLITFNQKEEKYGISEEIWLNEARSEYVPTLLGYNDVYEGSNLERRFRNFIDNPSDSITEWQDKISDYGALTLFTHYLVDHYGVEILVDSLHSREVGISSINYALKKNGFKKNFSQIFTDWAIAVLVNDCEFNENYCYLNKNLKDFKVNPSLNFLPFAIGTTLTVQNSIKDWGASWYKFVGGREALKIEFKGVEGVLYKVPYLLYNLSGGYTVGTLELDQNQRGEITFSDFSSKYASLVIIPLAQNKFFDFGSSDPEYPFSIIISTIKKEQTIKALLEKIAFLKQEIAKLEAQIQAILEKRAKKISCSFFENNLWFGMRNKQVKCLQEFLKSQGEEIYPEGLVTGYFGPLTKAAVIRFQEKYNLEILVPYGLKNGTGFVGPRTRAQINKILRSPTL